MMAHPAKVATPDAALTGLVVQVRVPDDEVSVIEADELVTTLPPESSTLTTGWALKATPLAVLAGVVLNTSWVAAPALMVKLPEVPEVNPVADAERV